MTTVEIDVGQSARITVQSMSGGGTTISVDVDPEDVEPTEPEPAPVTTLGWCPTDSTVAQIQAMLSKFPNPDLMRLYTQPGDGIAPWDSGILPLVPASCRLWYSFKDWDAATSPAKIRAWMSAAPARRGPTLVTLDHEPEQQDSSDPTPAQFRQEWSELLAAVADHPRRSEFMFGPVFTEYAATKGTQAPSWWADFGIVSTFPGVDFVGFDVYDTGYPSYRTPEQRNEFALSIGRRADVNLPVCFAEWGIARKTGIDSDGSGAAQAMRDNLAYLRAQPDVPLVSWFYRGQCVLDSPVVTNGITITRTKELQAFRELMDGNPA